MGEGDLGSIFGECWRVSEKIAIFAFTNPKRLNNLSTTISL